MAMVRCGELALQFTEDSYEEVEAAAEVLDSNPQNYTVDEHCSTDEEEQGCWRNKLLKAQFERQAAEVVTKERNGRANHIRELKKANKKLPWPHYTWYQENT